MTTGWIIVNIALALMVSALVAGVSVLVPHQLHRRALVAELQDVTTTTLAWTPDHERQAV